MKKEANFDELRMVMNSLRHDCQNTKSAKKAIRIISEKTKLSKEKVKSILVTLALK